MHAHRLNAHVRGGTVRKHLTQRLLRLLLCAGGRRAGRGPALQRQREIRHQALRAGRVDCRGSASLKAAAAPWKLTGEVDGLHALDVLLGKLHGSAQREAGLG